MRTIHSIYNRTPHELIHEIILINDNSTIDELYEPLQAYVRRNFNGVVKIFTMKERRGLAMCRIEGARLAKGEVLVRFMTSKAFPNSIISFFIKGVSRRSSRSKCELASPSSR